MKCTICLLTAFLLLPGLVQAQEKATEETEPKAEQTDTAKSADTEKAVEILRKVDAACKAIHSVKYDTEFKLTGADAAQLGMFKASVIASGWAHGEPEKYYIDAEFQEPGSTETRKVTLGTDGDMYFAIDHQTKTAHEDIDPAVMGRMRQVFGLAMVIEYLHDTPFNDEINARSQELVDDKDIGGEDCYGVRVVYQREGSFNTTWYVSKKDFLPRSRVDSATRPDGAQVGRVRTMTNVVADPKLDEDTFKLKLPEGYTKTDEFAP